MLRTFVFFTFFVFLSIASACKKKETKTLISNDVYYVFTVKDLNLRSQPSLDSDSLALLPRGTVIKVLEKTNNYNSVDGITSNWWKVEANGKTGYLFSGYISRYPPPKESYGSLYSYLTEFYGELNSENPNVVNYKKKETPCDEVENVEACGSEESFQIKTLGIEVLQKIGYEWGTEEIFFPDITEIEGFLLLQDCCRSEEGTFSYSQFKDMLDKNVPIPEFHGVTYLRCEVKRKENGLILSTTSGL